MRRRDLALLAELRADSRKSITEYSFNTGMALTTVYRRLDSVSRRYVKKYVSMVDFVETGFNVRALFFIRARNKKKLAGFLNCEVGLNNLYRVSGDADFLAEMVFCNNLDCEDFTDRMSMQDFVDSFAKSDILETVMVEDISFLNKQARG